MKIISAIGRFALCLAFDPCSHMRWYSINICNDCERERKRILEKLNELLKL